jgi:two-component system, NarL family, sensor kinase
MTDTGSAPAAPPAAVDWVRLSGPRAGQVSSRPLSAARIVVQFVIASVVAVTVLVVGGLVVSKDAARREALADARRTTDLLATAVIDPFLTPQLVAGDPGAIARLQRVVRARLLDAALVRIKIWTPDGRILFSDEPRLIGESYPLGADEQAALTRGSTEADLSDASAPENRYERGLGQLLEVYRPVQTSAGQPLLFETYSRLDVVAARGSDLWRTFAPIIVGVVVLVLLIQIPLAWWMVRRLRESQRERERLLHRALDASDDERRRIAANLHDGVVQDLAGASLALAGAADAASRDRQPSATVLRQASVAVREAIGGLRSVLFEIYPPNLRTTNLPAALGDLVAPMAARGLDVAVTVGPDVDLDADTEALLFRVAQETLRSAAKHARARRVLLDVRRLDTDVVMTVTDDGIGFDPQVVVAASAPGHVGLALVADLATSAGADLDVAAASGRGTSVRLTVAP